MQITNHLAQRLNLPGAGSSDITIEGPAGYNAGNTLGEIVSNIFPFLFVFAGIGLLLMLILGGFDLLTGASDPKKVEAGKQRITYAIVGFLLVFFTFWIVQFITLIFGITEFQSMFGISGSGSSATTTQPTPP